MTHQPTDIPSDNPIYTNSDVRGDDLDATIEGPALYALINPYGTEPYAIACQQADHILKADDTSLSIWVIGWQEERDIVLCHGYRWRLGHWDDWAYAPSFEQAIEQSIEKHQDIEDEYHE
tara:strand:- start:1944 stop:2303 length:360 start_codon:yes stop_codon:yes gene_type:complete